MHIQFDKNTVTFDSPHCLKHCSPSYQGATISGLNTSFDYLSCLPTLSDQAMNVFSADDFALNSCSRSLLYHYYCSHLSFYQVVNIFSIDKPTNCHFCSTSLSTSSQTSVSADTICFYNLCSYYSYKSSYCLDMADSLKTMNQEPLQTKDWVSPNIPNSQKKFVELLTMDILLIEAASFSMFM